LTGGDRRRCLACGEAAPAGHRFCGHCGTPLRLDGAPARHGPAAVLFADLTGYTDMVNRLEPEEVRGVLAAFYVHADFAVEGEGGRVHQRIGDCVMAVFAEDRALGVTSERAVAAALALRAGVRSIRARAGFPLDIHVGLAFGPVAAAPLCGEDSLVGPVVNLAARLCDEARAGEILVGPSSRRCLGRAFRLDRRGAFHLAGFDEPVPAWTVERAA
jgi:class 3 adenylate cyclase